MKKKTPLLIWILTALLFCYGFLLGGQQLVLTGICEQFGIGVLGMGTLVSVLHVASTLAPAVMGMLADRLGKKKVLVTFTILFGGGCLLAAVSGFLGLFVVSLLIIGAGYSVCESLTSAVCVEVNAQDGSRYINLTQCLLSVGAILGPVVMGLLPEFSFDTWRLLYIFCGVPLVVIGLILSRLPFPKGERVKEMGSGAKHLLLSPVFLALVVGIFLYVGLENGFGYFLEPLFATKTGGATLSAYGISAYWAGMAVARLIYSLRPYRPRRAVQLSFAAAAAAFVAMILLPGGWACFVLCFAVGFAYGPVWSTLVAGAAERFPQHKAGATGLMSAACGVGGIVYPVIMGAVTDFADIRVGFVLLAVSALAGAALAFVLKNTKEGD